MNTGPTLTITVTVKVPSTTTETFTSTVFNVKQIYKRIPFAPK
jgi:hypothetical protein